MTRANNSEIRDAIIENARLTAETIHQAMIESGEYDERDAMVDAIAEALELADEHAMNRGVRPIQNLELVTAVIDHMH